MENDASALARDLRADALALPDATKLWPSVARRLVDFFGCERVTIFERDEAGALVSRYAHGVPGEIRLAPGEGIAGWTAGTGRAYLSNNPYDDPLFYKDADRATRFVTRSLLAFPLHDAGRAAGVLELVNKPGGFSQRDLGQLQEIGSEVAVLFGKSKAEEGRRRLFEQLAQAEKMAALGRLSGAVAHEINNPLMAVLGLLEIALRAPGLPEEALKNLLKVDAEVRRIRLVASDLLGFARSSAPARKPVDLARCLEETLSLMAVELRHRNVKLSRRYQPGVAPVLADANQMKQVFLNLLLNAMQALEGREGTIAVSVRADPGAVVARVEDDGPGVPEDLAARIFEPFFTTKGDKGTGLGLSVSLGLIQANGGALTLARRSPGAAFELSFPPAA